jgi:VWFA-related protein
MDSLRLSVSRFHFFSLAMLMLALTAIAPAAVILAQTPASPSSQQPQQSVQAAPDSGGPSADTGVIALPKKKDSSDNAAPPAPAMPRLKNPEGTPNFSLRVEVPEVTVDVGVLLQKNGQFVPNLKPGNFRVYEDGKLQSVTSFKRTEAPISALLLCEFAFSNYHFIYDMRNAADAFASQLRPLDYVAVMTFDMKTRIVSDFTQDKRQTEEAINSLTIPMFSDRNLFDALYEAEDRLSRIEGRKYIILIASGRDTFSRVSFDKIMQKVKSTPDVTIFAVSTGGALRAMTEGGDSWGAQMRDMDYMQADNEMKAFARLTGGMWFAPRFVGEMPGIFEQINQHIRSKYQLVYHPTNAKQDGTYRKLRVDLVDEEGHPLRIQDEKHKPLKYDIIARDGYRAQQQVE